MAAYKSIADNVKSIKITKAIIISYILFLVVVPPIFILVSFLVFPSKTASFFNFQIKDQQGLLQSPHPQVLGEETSVESRGNVLSAYISAVLEPQAEAAVKALRTISPNTVSEVILPTEEINSYQPTQVVSTLIPGPQGIEGSSGPQGPIGTAGSTGEIGPSGPQGPQGSTGAVGTQGESGPQGLQGIQGPIGLTGPTGSVGALNLGVGLSGNILNGDLSLDLDPNTIFGLSPVNFLTPNISQWINDAGYITDGNVNWNNTYGLITSETDTLASVTERGAFTATSLILDGGITTTSINSATGNIIFTAGGTSSSGKVQIGASATTTPDLLILDNGTADPIGVNGGMYYNTSTSKFRCFENNVWANCINSSIGADLQHAASYDSNQALTNVASAQVNLGVVSVTPATTTADVYVTGFAEVRSSNGTDQPFNLVIETTNNCTGTVVGNASVTYVITAGANTTNHYGNIRVSGIAVDPGTSAETYSLCASTATGDTDVLNWGIEAIVIDTGADLAEIYTTNDASIEAGDVVSLDSNLKTGMKKSQIPYDSNILGIVSTRPRIVIGGVDKEGIKAMPVALSGRVPVKASTENGKINAGDPLTTSGTPGVAMRSTKEGATIGIAMTSFDGEEISQILAFVRPENVVETNVPDQIKEFVSNLFKETVEFFGNVIFQKDVNFLGRLTFNQDTAGHAVIKAGTDEVEVNFEKEYTKNPVVIVSVNLETGINGDEIPAYAIYDLSTKGFKIKLAKEATSNLSFSWIALSVFET